MTSSVFITVLLAGVVQRSVLTPMPYLRKWSWEFMTGEWKGIKGPAVKIQGGALIVLVTAMFTLGFASKL